jgi:hypothetical protein
MRTNRFSAIVISLAFLAALGAAAVYATRSPLPARILTAKTVFVDDHPGLDQDRAQREFFEEVSKWNRWRTVKIKGDADLVAVLTVRQKQPVNPANPFVGTTQLTFVDPATGRQIWSNTMPWSDRGAVRDLIDDLRKQVEMQEKHSRN